MSLVALLAACTSDPETPTTPTDPTVAPTGDTATTPAPSTALVVSSYFAGKVHLFDPVSGELIGVIDGVDGAQTVVVGPTGEWIACAELKNQILRIDPQTLEILGTLVADDPGTPDDETGGLQNPDAAIFGPDGRLYVSSFETDQILRYEADGTFVDVFVAAGAGGLDGPDIGLVFAPNGEFLVPGWYSHRVHRYDPDTGASLGDLVGPDQGLANPRAIVFDVDGRAYVSGWATNGVLRLDPATGETVKLVELSGATGMVLDEEAGELLLANDGEDIIHAYALETGDLIGERVEFRPIDGATAIGLLPR